MSGTVGLELAVANVPHLIAYKMNVMTYHLIRKILTTKYAHLANIILQKEIVPEFLQNDCAINNISKKALELLNDKDVRAKQQSNFDLVRKELGQNRKSSDAAAKFILNL